MDIVYGFHHENSKVAMSLLQNSPSMIWASRDRDFPTWQVPWIITVIHVFRPKFENCESNGYEFHGNCTVCELEKHPVFKNDWFFWTQLAI